MWTPHEVPPASPRSMRSRFARQHLGTLDRVCRVVRLGVAIATTGEHSGYVEVADGASELLRDVVGEAKMSCRLSSESPVYHSVYPSS